MYIHLLNLSVRAKSASYTKDTLSPNMVESLTRGPIIYTSILALDRAGLELEKGSLAGFYSLKASGIAGSGIARFECT